MSEGLSVCPGCGVELPDIEGPIHRYMTSSPACYEVFNRILATEYSDPKLGATHRLSVDTYAVQHPGSGEKRREIQSVGLHLARLTLQLRRDMSPQKTNEVMLGFTKHKASLIYLEPPKSYELTVADIEPHIGGTKHPAMVTQWAKATLHAWSAHHDYIDDWIEQTWR
ncbi:MAG: DUF5946 family protein [Pseudomonadota bacterium]